MKKILSLVVLLATLCTLRGQGSSEAMTGYTLPSASGVVFGTGGWAFTPSTNLLVSGLGCLQYLVTDQGSMQVGLWANNGSLLASTLIGSGNILRNGTYYSDLQSTLTLFAGNTYRIGVYSPSGSTLFNLVTQNADGSATLSPLVQLAGSATGSGGFGFPGTLGPNNTLLLGPNFLFTTTVPEPSSLALLGLACLGLLAKRAR